jgi:hypothetical protein
VAVGVGDLLVEEAEVDELEPEFEVEVEAEVELEEEADAEADEEADAEAVTAGTKLARTWAKPKFT